MTYNLEHLEQLEQAATPGEWDVNDRGIVQKDGWDDVVVPGAVSCGSYCYGGTSTIEGDKYDADAKLIVAARNALPSLIADLRRERERNAEVTQYVGEQIRAIKVCILAGDAEATATALDRIEEVKEFFAAEVLRRHGGEE